MNFMSQTIPTRPLGRSGMDITTVGFGAWAIGGPWAFGWGPQDDELSVAAIRHAVSRGVNWVDTAAAYGIGHSEEVVGRAVRDIPADERPLVFTKCGLVFSDPPRPDESPRRALAPDSIRRECEASLRRLGVERIDLYQFHWPDESGVPVEDSWATMHELAGEGKVRAVGVSNFDVDLLERCEAVGHVDSLQPPFSLIDRRAAADVIPWARERETGVIVYSPMQSGLLTGRWSRERSAGLDPGDWRAKNPEFHGAQLERNLALADALQPIADRHGASVAAVAVAWTLSWPGVTGAIVGGRSPEQVDGWVGAAGLELTGADLDEIAAAIERTGAGAGPVRPG
jgi:aryl-alcohol dehydrogenase-like predicted oxidoreductase